MPHCVSARRVIRGPSGHSHRRSSSLDTLRVSAARSLTHHCDAQSTVDSLRRCRTESGHRHGVSLSTACRHACGRSGRRLRLRAVRAVATISSPAVIGTWRLTYEAGTDGIAVGGGIRVRTDSDTDWGTPQFLDPAAADYMTVSTPEGVHASVRVGRAEVALAPDPRPQAGVGRTDHAHVWATSAAGGRGAGRRRFWRQSTSSSWRSRQSRTGRRSFWPTRRTCRSSAERPSESSSWLPRPSSSAGPST